MQEDDIAHATRKVYERNAAGFDRSRTRTLMERPWLERFCAHLPPASTILDAGCGSGRPIAQYLIEGGYGVTGVDFARPMLDLAAQRFPAATWLEGDLRSLALGRTFDGVIAWHSVFHLTPAEQRTALPLLADHVAPGGALMMTIGPDEESETTGHVEGEPVYHASLPEADYRRLLEEAGMEIVTLARDDEGCGGASVLLARKPPTGR